jgi:hypothetical protein
VHEQRWEGEEGAFQLYDSAALEQTGVGVFESEFYRQVAPGLSDNNLAPSPQPLTS